jgi:hypothetical protein
MQHDGFFPSPDFGWFPGPVLRLFQSANADCQYSENIQELGSFQRVRIHGTVVLDSGYGAPDMVRSLCNTGGVRGAAPVVGPGPRKDPAGL